MLRCFPEPGLARLMLQRDRDQMGQADDKAPHGKTQGSKSGELDSGGRINTALSAPCRRKHRSV